ncbi:MAG: SUMF1/EgtB/PvdO family nonheme iron enzyme [Candidatus Hydrogenedentes bacterium]|nr:SUMF1/EgtB/PvdO family nonheme iron enzyme [Candidatus Hydrogenedentota bacterium]
MHVHTYFRRFSFFLTLAVVASIALTSCPPPTPEEESLKVLLATGMPVAGKSLPKGLVPVDDAAILSLEARIQAIRILSLDGTETESTSVLSSAKTVDLLDLTDVAALLSDTTVPAGSYSGVELVISEASMVLVNNPLETIALALADGGTYTLDFDFEIAPESAGLLFLELGGLNVLEGEGGNFTLSPALSAGLATAVLNAQIAGSIESIDNAAETFVLAAGAARYTVDYTEADIFVPGDYGTPSGTPAVLSAGTDVAVVGTAGANSSIAPHTIVVVDLPGTPEDDEGDLITVCLLADDPTPTAQTIQVSRNRLDQIIALGGFEGPCDGGDPFTLTYAAGPGGTVEGLSPQSVAPGADGSAVTAVPLDGFAFVNWSDGSTLNPRRDRAVGADITVTANFAELFALSYTAGAGGTIAGNASQLVPEGGSGSPVTAVRDDSFVFDGWSDGRTDNPRTDINIAADLAVTANFLEVFQLTYTAGTGGTVEGVTQQSVIDGNDGTAVTAIPGEGFIFIGWSDGVEENTRTDLNVDGDVTVTANFLAQYTLTYVAGANGTITGATSQIVNDGEDGTAVTAVPNATFGFAGWSDGRADNPRTDVDVDGDVTVTANFATAITLSYAADTHGTLTGATEQVIGSGGTGTAVTAVPNEGYGFDQWSDGRTDNPRVDTGATSDLSVTAEFVPAFTLTYLASEGGTLTGATTQIVNTGGSGTAVTAAPNASFVFDKWSDNTKQNPRTDVNVVSDVTVTAQFVELFTLTYTAGSNGSLTGPASQTIRDGADGRTVTAVPANGFGFDGWSDGVLDNPRTDLDVSGDISVTANFSATLTVTYEAGENGDISGVSIQDVEVGASTTAVTAVPNEGYLFSQWSDGSTDNPRTDTDVIATKSFTASFFEDVVMLPVPAGTFTMGPREDGDDALFDLQDELPRREVTLDAYEIGKFEVNNAQFAEFMNFMHHPSRDLLKRPNGSSWQGFPENVWFFDSALPRVVFAFALTEDGIDYDQNTNSFVTKVLEGVPAGTFYDKATHPVTEPTWYGAVLFANWLSERSGLEPVYDTDTWTGDFTKNGYRLPSEAEWERAAAWDGEKHWIYPITSDELTTRDRVNFHVDSFRPNPDYGSTSFINPLGIIQDAKESYTSPVGWFNGINISPNGNIQTVDSPSPVGAYDMAGNVVEWCDDWYSATYYSENVTDNPRGPEVGTDKVARGGAWARLVKKENQRSARRFRYDPNHSDGINGFRLAR